VLGGVFATLPEGHEQPGTKLSRGYRADGLGDTPP
jgi:hypothetical protein